MSVADRPLSAPSLPDAQMCPPPAPYPAPPSDTALRVCVIGSGAAGSAATKACLEGGVLPTCLEQQESSGGIWRFDTRANAPSSVYRSTVINTSKELSAFSDFPVAEAAPTYMHHQYMLRYIQAYRRHFGLDAYTRYHTRVVDVRQVRRDSLSDEERNALPDAEISGASPHSFEFVWRVESETVSESHTDAAVGSVAASDSASGDGVGRARVAVRRVEHFHGLMVCTGHHSTPHQVRFPNQDAFRGRILHSHDYKDERPFLGQRVCVVGVGNSGVDIAVELSRHCSHTVLSTRSGVWIFPRLGLGGRPLDHVLVTRWMQYAVPAWIKGWLLETLCRLLSGDMGEVGLAPLHRLLSAHQTTNAELVPRIRTGMLRVHRDILRFTPEGAVFADQPEVEEKLDAVVLATGYDIALPFLRSEPHLLSAVLQDDNRWTAYKFVFPLDSQYHSAAFIGFMQPQGQHARTRTRWGHERTEAPQAAGGSVLACHDVAHEERNVEYIFQFLISLSARCFVCFACQAQRIRSSRCSLAGTCPSSPGSPHYRPVWPCSSTCAVSSSVLPHASPTGRAIACRSTTFLTWTNWARRLGPCRAPWASSCACARVSPGTCCSDLLFPRSFVCKVLTHGHTQPTSSHMRVTRRAVWWATRFARYCGQDYSSSEQPVPLRPAYSWPRLDRIETRSEQRCASTVIRSIRHTDRKSPIECTLLTLMFVYERKQATWL